MFPIIEGYISLKILTSLFCTVLSTSFGFSINMRAPRYNFKIRFGFFCQLYNFRRFMTHQVIQHLNGFIHSVDIRFQLFVQLQVHTKLIQLALFLTMINKLFENISFEDYSFLTISFKLNIMDNASSVQLHVIDTKAVCFKLLNLYTFI